MSRPTLLVVTLLVLWLIVLVPMIFRRVDEGAQSRSVRRYGRSMGLLNRRHVRPLAVTTGSGGGHRGAGGIDAVSYVSPRITAPRDELFVPGADRRRGEGEGGRRPAFAGQEGPMNRADRADMSDARRQMMARRRRSLTILISGSVLSLMLAFLIGGALVALMATLFCLGLGGYIYFLRTQALRDRERRAWREERSFEQPSHHEESFDEDDEYFEEASESMVRIDDDNIDLHDLDTIDLTGISDAPEYRDLRERRAS